MQLTTFPADFYPDPETFKLQEAKEKSSPLFHVKCNDTQIQVFDTM